MVSSADAALVFSATSLFESFHEVYENTDLYFACHPQFKNILNGNPYVKKVLQYQPEMEDEFLMIGRGSHKGYVDYYINLNNSHLKNISAKKHYEFC